MPRKGGKDKIVSIREHCVGLIWPRCESCAHSFFLGKKRHIQRLGLNDVSELVADKVPATTNPCILPVNNLPIFYLLQCPGIREQALEFLRKAAVDWSLSMPIPRDLPALSRLNSFDALARNALILGIPVGLLESDDGVSPFVLIRPEQARETPSSLPTHLCPTALQRTVRHHPWLDLFPFPKMRDNILEGLRDGELDEDQLANEFVCDFLDLGAVDTASLMIWGDSWDMFGWEICPDFFRKWGPLLNGCQDVLQATNKWRTHRNAAQLSYVLN